MSPSKINIRDIKGGVMGFKQLNERQSDKRNMNVKESWQMFKH